MALTERQQEIKTLQDQGKTPREIAEALGITVNGIYQQLRRMKGGGNAKKSGKPKPNASTKAVARKLADDSRPTSRPALPLPPRVMTPLQAIRARKQAIEQQLKESASAISAAASTLTKLNEGHGTLVLKHAEELKQLQVAEGIITGEVPITKPVAKKPASKNGAGKPAAGTADPPQQVTAPVQQPVAAPPQDPFEGGTVDPEPAPAAA
jgi:IS30 family transposase